MKDIPPKDGAKSLWNQQHIEFVPESVLLWACKVKITKYTLSVFMVYQGLDFKKKKKNIYIYIYRLYMFHSAYGYAGLLLCTLCSFRCDSKSLFFVDGITVSNTVFKWKMKLSEILQGSL